MDIFRQYDDDHDGSLTRDQFIDGLSSTSKLGYEFCIHLLATVVLLSSLHILISLLSAFPTERWELQLVARKLERRGHISYKDFVASLKAVSITSVTIFLKASLHCEIISSQEFCMGEFYVLNTL